MELDLNAVLFPKGEDLDNTPLTFGRYKGRTPDDISDEDPDYIVWMYKNVEGDTCSKALYNFCKKAVEEDEEE